MRNASRYRAMAQIFYISELMIELTKDIVNKTTSDEGAVRDIAQGIRERADTLSKLSSDAMRDEFDFGPTGKLFPFGLAHAIEDVFEKHGVIPALKNDESKKEDTK